MRTKEKGRILRVKKGYNPNSSSIGSMIPKYFAFVLGSGIIAVIISNLSNVFSKKKPGKKTNSRD